MKFTKNHRYLIRFPSMMGVMEVKCLEVSPSGWVKLMLNDGEEVWYSPENQKDITIVDDLGSDSLKWLDWRSWIVHE